MVTSQVDTTLNLDAQPTTRAIRAHADTREEIEQMFDGISYGKAGAVLLMVENYLGEETFRQGVHNYLAAHLYGNATAEDFWSAQTATSHKPVDKIMESLVAQPGEPLLTFGEAKDGKVEVSQKRFFLSPSIQPDPKQKWTIPVCFKTTSGQDCQLLTPSDSSLKIPAGGGFCQRQRQGLLSQRLSGQRLCGAGGGRESKLTASERISLIGDEWVQVRANKATIGAYLDLAAAVKSDPGSDVVDESLNGINSAYFAHCSHGGRARPACRLDSLDLRSGLRQTRPPAENDSANTRELRAELFGLLGHRGADPAILAQAREIAAKFLADPAFRRRHARSDRIGHRRAQRRRRSL
jgi:aminopeptidase N